MGQKKKKCFNISHCHLLNTILTVLTTVGGPGAYSIFTGHEALYLRLANLRGMRFGDVQALIRGVWGCITAIQRNHSALAIHIWQRTGTSQAIIIVKSGNRYFKIISMSPFHFILICCDFIYKSRVLNNKHEWQ